MPQDPDTPKLVEVADGFHVRQEIDNIAWADMGGYAVVVDALEHAEKEAEVFDAIARTIPDVPVRYVLNTHTHYDHVALNDAFRREHGAEIVNARTADIPEGGKRFEGERRQAVMLPLPGCHTREDCLVWFPDDEVLFTGDLFGWGLIPLTRRLNDESARALLDAYERMIGFGARVVVPGHGPLCDTDTLRRWTEYFRWLIEAADAGLREGKTARQVQAELQPPEDMRSWWRFVQWKHADSAEKVVSAVGSGSLHSP